MRALNTYPSADNVQLPPTPFLFGIQGVRVVNLHHATRKGFHGTQCQRHLAMPWRDASTERMNVGIP